MVNKIYADTEARMQKSLQAVKDDLSGIRSGKATPALLENLKVEAYGQKSPLNQLATISAPDPKSLLVQPWDKSILGDVVKAIQVADLGFNPQVEGNLIRVPVPPLSEERRKDLVKVARKISEDGKIAVRNIRRDANDNLKKAEKEKEISEDEQHKGSDKVQKLTDKYIDEIDQIASAKEKEILSI